MAKCEVCGNDYDKSFEVSRGGERHTFDSFECAVHKMAPSCAHCGCKVVGHGVEASGKIFCCANCARMSGHSRAARSRLKQPPADHPLLVDLIRQQPADDVSRHKTFAAVLRDVEGC